jgi:hypothetical protein
MFLLAVEQVAVVAVGDGFKVRHAPIGASGG